MESPRVKVPPPAILALSLVSIWILEKRWPFFLNVEPAWGRGIFLVGLVFIFFCTLLFRKNRTEIAPWKPSSVLIRSGPYRFIRNPIYLGMLLMVLGAGILFKTLWGIVVFFGFWIFLRFYVVAREETYLKSRFGSAYVSYCNKVPRGF